MLSMRSIFVLAVLLVNAIHCEDAKNKPKEVSAIDNSTIVVNDVTETIDAASTLFDNTTTASTTLAPPGNKTDAPVTPPTVPTKPSVPTVPTVPTVPSSTVPPPSPPLPPPNGTNVTTTTVSPNTTVTTSSKPPASSSAAPVPASTPGPAPVPHKDRHFDGASFIGGIILAVGLMGIGFIAFKFYKARTERNYHTL